MHPSSRPAGRPTNGVEDSEPTTIGNGVQPLTEPPGLGAFDISILGGAAARRCNGIDLDGPERRMRGGGPCVMG